MAEPKRTPAVGDVVHGGKSGSHITEIVGEAICVCWAGWKPPMVSWYPVEWLSPMGDGWMVVEPDQSGSPFREPPSRAELDARIGREWVSTWEMLGNWAEMADTMPPEHAQHVRQCAWDFACWVSPQNIG